MADSTFPRSWLVRRDRSAAGGFFEFMAHPAWYVFMRPAERKGRLGFVVEVRGRPAAGVVTAPAIHRAVVALELPPMNVLVATRA